MTSNAPQQMESFTVEEFQLHFDELLERIEDGESFIIKSEYGNAIMMPYENMNGSDDVVKCFYDHNDGC
jgi:hypothetical protein